MALALPCRPPVALSIYCAKLPAISLSILHPSPAQHNIPHWCPSPPPFTVHCLRAPVSLPHSQRSAHIRCDILPEARAPLPVNGLSLSPCFIPPALCPTSAGLSQTVQPTAFLLYNSSAACIPLFDIPPRAFDVNLSLARPPLPPSPTTRIRCAHISGKNNTSTSLASPVGPKAKIVAITVGAVSAPQGCCKEDVACLDCST